MMNDEQQWNRLKNEFHFYTAEFLNQLQTMSVADLSNAKELKKIIANRYEVINAFAHVFRFVDDVNIQNVYDILKDPESPGSE